MSSSLGTAIGIILLGIIALAFWLGSDKNIEEMHRMEHEQEQDGES